MPGDELAFTRAWMAAQPAVASTLLALVWDRHAVDDLLQEVATAAFTSWNTFDPARDFTAWAIGIARHKAIDWLRRRQRPHLGLASAEAQAAVAAAAAELAGELAERERALHRCLGTLAGRGRDLVRMHYEDGKPLADAATALGITLANAKVILHRVRAALRTCIERRATS